MGEGEEEFTEIDEKTVAGPKVTLLANEDPEAWEKYHAAWEDAYADFEPETAHLSKEGAAWLSFAPDEGITSGNYYRKYEGLDDDELRDALRRDFKAAEEDVRRIDRWYEAVTRAAEAVIAEDPWHETLAGGYSNGPLHGLDGMIATVSARLIWGHRTDPSEEEVAGIVRTLLANEAKNRGGVLAKYPTRPRTLELAASDLVYDHGPTGVVMTGYELMSSKDRHNLTITKLDDPDAVAVMGYGAERQEWDIEVGNGVTICMVLDIPGGRSWEAFDDTIANAIHSGAMEQVEREWDRDHPGERRPMYFDRNIEGGYSPTIACIARDAFGSDEVDAKQKEMIIERLNFQSKCWIHAYDKARGPKTGRPYRALEVGFPRTTTRDGYPRGYVTIWQLPEAQYMQYWANQWTYVKNDYRRTPDIPEKKLKELNPKAWEIATRNKRLKSKKDGKCLALVVNVETANMRDCVLKRLGQGGNKGMRKYRTRRDVPEWGCRGVVLDVDDIISDAWGDKSLDNARKKHIPQIEIYLLFLLAKDAILDFKPMTTADYSDKDLDFYDVEQRPDKPRLMHYLVRLRDKRTGPGTLWMQPTADCTIQKKII